MLMRMFAWPLIAALICVSAGALAETKWLITPEEAARARPVAGELKELAAAREGPGPLIVVKNPRGLKTVRSPVDIFVAFEPGKSGQPPDMNTLSVALVGFIDIDITDRLREYINGSNLEVEKANLPTGIHRLRMAIKDVEGNPNERDVVVRVVEE